MQMCYTDQVRLTHWYTSPYYTLHGRFVKHLISKDCVQLSDWRFFE